MVHRRYLDFNTNAILLGLRAGILGSTFSLIYVLYFHQNLNFILAVTGVFTTTLIEITGLNSPYREQIKHGLIISFCAGITVALGSIAASDQLLLSIGMIAFMWPVGLSGSSRLLPSTTVLFIANMFIIGSDLAAPVNQAIVYGVFFCLGGLCVVASTYLQQLFFSDTNNLTYQTDKKERIFSLNSTNIKFAIKLSIAVFIANAIAGYLKFPQQYCAPMTALLILRSDHRSSILRINHRLFGTLIGGILAGILIILIQNKVFLAILMGPILFFIVVSMARHYGAYVFFLTTMITILFNLIEYEGISVTFDRIIYTLLGISIVVAVVYLSKFLAQQLEKYD